MTICERFDIVAVPFPFSDAPRAKRRKALVLSPRSFNEKNGASLLMMITSAAHSSWHLDVKLDKWREAGLQKPCLARMKIFTLDNRLILGKVGQLLASDRKNLIAALRLALP